MYTPWGKDKNKREAFLLREKYKQQMIRRQLTSAMIKVNGD